MNTRVLLGSVAALLVVLWPCAVAGQAVVTEQGVTVDLAPGPEQVTISGPRTPMEAEGESWGTSSWVAVNIPGITFQPQWDVQYGHYGNGAIHKYAGTGSHFHAPVVLPEGALIAGFTPTVYDSNASKGVDIWSYRCAGAPDNACTLLGEQVTSGTPGWQENYLELPGGPHTYRTWDYSTYHAVYYRLYLKLSDVDGVDGSLRFKGVVVWYHNQVSPAPASATFSDVPVGAFAFQHIEALVASGITAGCGSGNFCPNAYVTRAQMAVFLAKALGLHWQP